MQYCSVQILPIRHSELYIKHDKIEKERVLDTHFLSLFATTG